MNTNDYVENKLQPPRAFFEWCYTSFRTYVWKNKNETIVASTRKHDWIIEKKLRKNSRLTFYDSSNCFQIVLSTSKRIEVQTYKVISEYENGVQCFREQLECIEIFSNNQHIKIGKICLPVYYGYNMGVALYPNGWIQRLERVSELKYLNLEQLNVYKLATTYKYRSLIEYAQKINAHKLAYDIMTGSVDMRMLTKNCLRKYKTFLKNTDNSLKEIQLKQTFESLNIPMVKGIEKYVLKSDISNFPKEIGAVKFQNWLVKQGKSFKYYQDYLNMLTLLKIEINKRNQLPPDLEVAHDCAVDRINQVNYEERDKEIKERLEQLRKYERDIDGYTFVLPKRANDIKKEGKALNHCVASYISRHAKGETTIIFVREKKNPQKSYFTLEYNYNRVVQLQGKKNRQKVPDELKQAVDKWVKVIKD